MINNLLESNIAIVGAGKFCKAFLKFLFRDGFADRRPNILGVADINEGAAGFEYARDKGILTTTDYTELFHLKNLQVIIELTHDPALFEIINRTKPSQVKLINHLEAGTVWDSLQLEELRIKGQEKLHQEGLAQEKILTLFRQLTDNFSSILKERNNRSLRIEMELIEQERSQSQIIQGSTIPTFVINKDHVVTHWNKALERLSGHFSDQIVGTTKQWVPFWNNERPTMADVILDQIEEDEIQKLYGEKWRKSALISGAYEAEVFFSSLGENGKWLWFTAAPIKGPDGSIIGAIETLWDKTEDKKAEEQKEQYTRELAALCSIYTALNAPLNLDIRIKAVIEEIKSFLSADSICIFMLEDDSHFRLKYSAGTSESLCRENSLAAENSIIYRVAQSNEITILEDLPDGSNEEIGLDKQEGLKSLAYIPVSAKEKKTFGVIRIGCVKSKQFTPEERHVLELIGNRIGAAVENTILQEQYIKSEEKYRSLFNNDPNPIFILDNKTHTILDINQRAQDCYGYTKKELFGYSFFNLGDEDDEEVISGLKFLTQNQSVLFSKKRHYKKGHKPFYVNISVSCAEYGESYVLIATTTDITESIEKETQLIQAGKMTTLGVMAAGLAHEINQPLNVIQICADFFLKMLKKGEPIQDEDLSSMANDIVENVERAAGIIKHVRDFARQSDVVKSKVNINEPVKDVFKVLGHQLKVHQIELKLNLDPELPEIMADHNRLEQVFINLVTNAIDAMDEKTEKSSDKTQEKLLTIKTSVQNENILVSVIDTGIGMTEEVKNKIFEPFFTTKKIGKGTGLGISISYGIVKDYDGSIEIESEAGKGTTFNIKFPFTR